MPTIYRPDSGRLTIAEVKRLILEASPREEFVSAYRRADGKLKAVPNSEPKSIYAAHMDEDFVSNCEQLGIVPRWKYRPGMTGYAGNTETDNLYTIEHGEFVRLAQLFDSTVADVKCGTEVTVPAVALPEPQRRLAGLRALGGAVKWWKGKWSVTGIGKLVKQEKAEGRNRRSEKTIRADLHAAAEAEKREGHPRPPANNLGT